MSSRRAASSNGSGCGLACGVVSPQITVRQLANSGIVRVSGSAKRFDLLVTTPQGRPRPASVLINSSTPSNANVRSVMQFS